MEKRKLAQIPREEATDEMVRFAERAAGTHIVTTRDIEKDLLMMTFYPIDKLKKGEKSAQLRTFFSKNDYISQDLTAERVKWLTAAFDRMECIHLYEYHWDRDKGNRYAQEIKNEGAALHHCVGTYVDRVAKGQTHIFFVRRVEEPDTPYFTMEYNKGRVIQCRGSHNCEMPSSVKTFVAAFEKLMKEREEKIERKCG